MLRVVVCVCCGTLFVVGCVLLVGCVFEVYLNYCCLVGVACWSLVVACCWLFCVLFVVYGVCCLLYASLVRF